MGGRVCCTPAPDDLTPLDILDLTPAVVRADEVRLEQEQQSPLEKVGEVDLLREIKEIKSRKIREVFEAYREVKDVTITETQRTTTEETQGAEKQQMEVEFFADGKTIILKFVRKPLGMQFTNKKRPLVFVSLVKPGSHADELGVRVDWQIKKISGKDLGKLEKFKELLAFWQEKVAALPEAAVASPSKVSFVNETKDNETEPRLTTTEETQEAEKQQMEVEFFADGKTIILRFVRKPLGMQFTNKKRPLVFVSLVKPGSHADELGVRVDWQIKKIAGKDVARLAKFKELSAFWKEQVASISGATMALQDSLEETKDNETEPQLITTEETQEAERKPEMEVE